jgi:hypothetical protein
MTKDMDGDISDQSPWVLALDDLLEELDGSTWMLAVAYVLRRFLAYADSPTASPRRTATCTTAEDVSLQSLARVALVENAVKAISVCSTKRHGWFVYEGLLEIPWLPPNVRRAVMKELGRSVQKEKSEFDQLVAPFVRQLIDETKVRMRSDRNLARGGVHEKAVEEVARHLGTTAGALKKRLGRSRRRARNKETSEGVPAESVLKRTLPTNDIKFANATATDLAKRIQRWFFGEDGENAVGRAAFRTVKADIRKRILRDAALGEFEEPVPLISLITAEIARREGGAAGLKKPRAHSAERASRQRAPHLGS